MTDTVNLGLPCIEGSQAQKHVTHNDALRILDTLVQLAVLDRDLTAPPGAPAEGQRFIVKAGASGPWAGHDNAVAAWQDGAWIFSVPKTGWVAFVADEGTLLVWNGTAWGDFFSTVTSIQNLARLGIGTTADATNPLSAKLNNALFAALSVAEGGDGNLHYKLSKESAAKSLSLLFQDNYSGRAEIGLAGDDDFHVKVSADGSSWYEALRVAASGGLVTLPVGQLAFPATQNPSSDPNTFDDYEEGTFTPILDAATTSPTGVTYNTQLGVYTKIGRVVTFVLNLTMLNLGTGGSGNALVKGFPFAAAAPAANVNPFTFAVRLNSITLTAGYSFASGRIDVGQSYGSVVEQGSGLVQHVVQYSQLANNTGIIMAGSYSV